MQPLERIDYEGLPCPGCLSGPLSPEGRPAGPDTGNGIMTLYQGFRCRNCGRAFDGTVSAAVDEIALVERGSGKEWLLGGAGWAGRCPSCGDPLEERDDDGRLETADGRITTHPVFRCRGCGKRFDGTVSATIDHVMVEGEDGERDWIDRGPSASRSAKRTAWRLRR